MPSRQKVPPSDLPLTPPEIVSPELAAEQTRAGCGTPNHSGVIISMNDSERQEFARYLKDVEEKAPKTIADYCKFVSDYLSPSCVVPSNVSDFEKLEYAWLAYRRFRTSIDGIVPSLDWLPAGRWIEEREGRIGKFRLETAEDEKRIIVVVKKSGSDILAWCLACDEVQKIRGEPATMEAARAAARLVVDDHIDRTSFCGAWCESLPPQLDESVFHLIWLHFPDFAPWPEVARVRCPGGSIARANANEIADRERLRLEVEAEEQLYSLTPNTSSGCTCGYMAVAGWESDGADCPICGFAGYR